MTVRHLGLALVLVGLCGCSSSASDRGSQSGASSIVGGGEDATAMYPEFIATFGQFQNDAAWYINCSGVLIAPTVAVTAAHCNDTDTGAWAGFRLQSVALANNQGAHIVDRVVFTDTAASDMIANDVLLLHLDTPLQVSTYATIRTGANNPTAATLVGRMVDTQSTRTGHMIRGKSIYFQPDNLLTEEATNGGDSGGPMFLDGGHDVLGLLHGGGSPCLDWASCDTYARFTDDLADKIATKAAAWGAPIKVHHEAITPLVNSWTQYSGPPATVYEDCNYGGWGAQLGAFAYNAVSLDYIGMPNRAISAVHVKAGYKVTLYSGDHQTGQSVTLNQDDGCLLDKGFNDATASLKVEPATPKISVLRARPGPNG